MGCPRGVRHRDDVQGSGAAGKLERSERSARDQPKLRMIEARALVALLMAEEQHPADDTESSAFVAVETYRQARVQPRKKVRSNSQYASYRIVGVRQN